MESHLSSDAGLLLALVPWPPCAVRAVRVAAGCVSEPGLAVCPASWPACVPVAWCCGAVLCPAPWCVGLLSIPAWVGGIIKVNDGSEKETHTPASGCHVMPGSRSLVTFPSGSWWMCSSQYRLEEEPVRCLLPEYCVG